MNRRSFFRLVAGAAGWLATKHVAWAFPPVEHRTVLDLSGLMAVLDYGTSSDVYLGLPRTPWVMSQTERDRYNLMVEGDERYRL